MQALLSLQEQDQHDAQNARQPGLPLAQETREAPSSDIPLVTYLLPPGLASPSVSRSQPTIAYHPGPWILHSLRGEPLVHPLMILSLVLSLPI